MQTQANIIVSSQFEKVVFDDENFRTLASFHVSIDPITKRRVAEVYTDDGKGNGDCILIIELD